MDLYHKEVHYYVKSQPKSSKTSTVLKLESRVQRLEYLSQFHDWVLDKFNKSLCECRMVPVWFSLSFSIAHSELFLIPGYNMITLCGSDMCQVLQTSPAVTEQRWGLSCLEHCDLRSAPLASLWWHCLCNDVSSVNTELTIFELELCRYNNTGRHQQRWLWQTVYI